MDNKNAENRNSPTQEGSCVAFYIHAPENEEKNDGRDPNRSGIQLGSGGLLPPPPIGYSPPPTGYPPSTDHSSFSFPSPPPGKIIPPPPPGYAPPPPPPGFPQSPPPPPGTYNLKEYGPPKGGQVYGSGYGPPHGAGRGPPQGGQVYGPEYVPLQGGQGYGPEYGPPKGAGYGPPQGGQGYGPVYGPPQGAGYGPPQGGQGYGPVYGPPQGAGYGPPQGGQGYGPGYGSPQGGQGYGPGYGPPQGGQVHGPGYGPPQGGQGYGPGYGPPQGGQGYGFGYGPPQGYGYGSPDGPGYGQAQRQTQGGSNGNFHFRNKHYDGPPIDYIPENENRNEFVRLVFCLVFAMLLFTAIGILMAVTVTPLNRFLLRHGFSFAFLGMGLLMVINCGLSCTEWGRRLPGNVILLILGTLAQTMFCMGITVNYKTHVLLYAFVTTAVVVLICLGLACTKFDFTSYWLYVIVGILAMFVLILVVAFVMIVFGVYMKPLLLFLLIVLTLLLCVSLVMELQMILGGKSIELSKDDYALAAFSLYTSIIDIFMKLILIVYCFDN